MTASRVMFCSHPGTPFEGKRPSSPVNQLCHCGANWSCPTCGFGAGAVPCQCSHDHSIGDNMPTTKPRCEDIGFVHAWEDVTPNVIFTSYPPCYPNPQRRCKNCGRVEEQVVVQPEVREWRNANPVIEECPIGENATAKVVDGVITEVTTTAGPFGGKRA